MASLSSTSRPSCRACLCLLVVLAGPVHATVSPPGEAERLFDRGLTWEQFLAAAKAQRELWILTTEKAAVPSAFVRRFQRVRDGLRLVVVAEDWCPDSLNALPYVARLAAAAAVPLRIVDRAAGEPLMRSHRTPDGRPATPTVVLLRDGGDVGAWVERPAIVQRWFLSMATNPESARRFGQRQSWYESDRGHAILAEVTLLAERTAPGK